MIDVLLADTELRGVLDAMRAGDDHEDVIARVAWSVIAEPGDGVAGVLRGELGAAEALRVALGDPVPWSHGARSDDAAAGGQGTTRRALAEGRARWRPRAAPAAVTSAFRGAHHSGAGLLLPDDDSWPVSIDDLGAHAPAVLWVRGDPRLLISEPRIAMVGARAASGYGELVASELSGDLASGGAVIVSGGAYGIDGAAHRAALAVEGGTVAFLAGGVDRAYPQGHQQLLRAIAERGAVVSEMPCGSAPTKWRFLARNRLIAAVSDATVVVEAGWRSGSLNTAGHAAALGRPLGAVPGPVTSASSAGCHRLLREYDARCVTSAAEVRELYGGELASAARSERTDPDQVRLLDAMSSRAAVQPLELSRRSGLAPDRVSALLGLLALEGEIVESEAGWRRLSRR